jgi:hypothetical protein
MPSSGQFADRWDCTRDDVPMSELVKIRFDLDQDDSGWPPAESEGLWAAAVGPNRFRLDNTPWFVRGVAADDIVEAAPDRHPPVRPCAGTGRANRRSRDPP